MTQSDSDSHWRQPHDVIRDKKIPKGRKPSWVSDILPMPCPSLCMQPDGTPESGDSFYRGKWTCGTYALVTYAHGHYLIDNKCIKLKFTHFHHSIDALVVSWTCGHLSCASSLCLAALPLFQPLSFASFASFGHHSPCFWLEKKCQAIPNAPSTPSVYCVCFCPWH